MVTQDVRRDGTRRETHTQTHGRLNGAVGPVHRFANGPQLPFHQLKRKDQVVLYANTSGHVGSLVDYSGQRTHTKHSTISVNPVQGTEYTVPSGYTTGGVIVASTILQRILREYKSISKRIVVTGNPSYIHIAADSRYSPWKWSSVRFGVGGGMGVSVPLPDGTQSVGQTALGTWRGQRARASRCW